MTEQEAFETWAKTEGLKDRLSPNSRIKGVYQDDYVDDLWDGWKARAAHAAILQAATCAPMQEETVIPTWRERLSMLDKPTDFAIAMAAKMESTELRRELARIKAATRDDIAASVPKESK